MKKKRLLAAIALALGANAAFASPAEDVITPDIEKGEREFEFTYGTDRNDEGKYESALELSFGAGITDRWATELGVEFERERGEHMKYSGIEWENRLGLIIELDALAMHTIRTYQKSREAVIKRQQEGHLCLRRFGARAAAAGRPAKRVKIQDLQPARPSWIR